MSVDVATGCDHCFHLDREAGQFALANGLEGHVTEQCCHCGTTILRKWRMVSKRDPEHGAFAPSVMVRVFDPPRVTSEGKA